MFGILKNKISSFGDKLKNNLSTKAKTNSQKEPIKKETEPKTNFEKNKQNLEEIIKKEEIEILDFQNKKDTEKDKKTEENIVKEKEILKKENLFEEEKRNLKTSVGKGKKFKGFFSGKIEITEKDIKDLLWELELSLIESDVEQDTAKEITTKIKNRLLGEKVELKNIDGYLKKHIKEILEEMMVVEKIDLLTEVSNKKPYKILMIGPNGAGKTTSIAKLTYLLQKANYSCIWAAGDTFRSGAIDQLQEHADNLNVKLIKQGYGSDPTAVAFDTVKSAEANKIDVVLIDSAGRQETNKNLMEELKKIERVIKPDLKIYVGEAYTGQSLLDMTTKFNEELGIDGFILTKIDADAKGGTTISLLYKLKKPILYVGTGQNYEDFEEFNSKFIIDRII